MARAAASPLEGLEELRARWPKRSLAPEQLAEAAACPPVSSFPFQMDSYPGLRIGPRARRARLEAGGARAHMLASDCLLASSHDAPLGPGGAARDGGQFVVARRHGRRRRRHPSSGERPAGWSRAGRRRGLAAMRAALSLARGLARLRTACPGPSQPARTVICQNPMPMSGSICRWRANAYEWPDRGWLTD